MMELTFTRANNEVIKFVERSESRQYNRWVKGDFELLGTPFARTRKEISGQPQTVNLLCRDSGLIPATGNYKRIVKELNPGMTDADLIAMMDKWTPDNAKWREGEEKVPTEIIFASNPVNVLDMIPNPGGLTGVPVGAMIYQLDALDYETLFMYTAASIPDRYVMHFTNNLNGRDVVNPPPVPGRGGLPVRLPITSKSPMYIRVELLDEIRGRNNRYSPPWDKGWF